MTTEIPQAKDVIEQYTFASILGQVSILTLVDDRTAHTETFVFMNGLPLTYLRALCMISASFVGCSHTLGLYHGDDDGLARIWSRVTMPDRATERLSKGNGYPEMAKIVYEAIDIAVAQMVDRTLTRSQENAAGIVRGAVQRIEDLHEASLTAPIRVLGLSELLAPVIIPPAWIKPAADDIVTDAQRVMPIANPTSQSVAEF